MNALCGKAHGLVVRAADSRSRDRGFESQTGNNSSVASTSTNISSYNHPFRHTTINTNTTLASISITIHHTTLNIATNVNNSIIIITTTTTSTTSTASISITTTTTIISITISSATVSITTTSIICVSIQINRQIFPLMHILVQSCTVSISLFYHWT
uniref:Uncharacterized protein n=1 Tax=Octopus bimaculoides TaxID=37653 RepID=A0A0L8HE68_OCTBM